jgi:hypothetical protein
VLALAYRLILILFVGSDTTWAEMVRIGVSELYSLRPLLTFVKRAFNLVTDKGIGVVGEEVT